MINKIEFSAKNLTSNAGLFLLLEHANKTELSSEEVVSFLKNV
ncbi:MAG TPA: hypothetical protein VF313_01875, partial [Anaerolineaceae bacterium]